MLNDYLVNDPTLQFAANYSGYGSNYLKLIPIHLPYNQEKQYFPNKLINCVLINWRSKYDVSSLAIINLHNVTFKKRLVCLVTIAL